MGYLTNNPEKVMVILRDGRKLQGVFRSYDQYGELLCAMYGVMLNYISSRIATLFPLRLVLLSRNNLLEYSVIDTALLFSPAANFLLESTIERLHYKLEYADRDIGELASTFLGRDSSRQVFY